MALIPTEREPPDPGRPTLQGEFGVLVDPRGEPYQRARFSIDPSRNAPCFQNTSGTRPRGSNSPCAAGAFTRKWPRGPGPVSREAFHDHGWFRA